MEIVRLQLADTAARERRSPDARSSFPAQRTHRAPGVLAEVAIANRLGIPVRQVIGYKDTSPTPLRNAGRLYRWSWPTLKSLLAPRRAA